MYAFEVFSHVFILVFLKVYHHFKIPENYLETCL